MPILNLYPQRSSIAGVDLVPFWRESDSTVNVISFDDLAASLDITKTTGILPLNRGGTGAILSAPGSDQILFYDQSAGKTAFLTIGTGLAIIGTTLSSTISGGGGGGGGAPIAATYITQLPNADLTNEFALSTLGTGLLKNATGTGVLSIAVAGTDFVGIGAITTSGLTQSTARLLGRTTASTGAIEQISVDSTLTLSAGSLGVTPQALTTLTWAATTSLDFTLPKQTVTATGDTTFTSVNLAATRSIVLRIVADSSNRGLTFPGSWTFVGGSVPASIAANKTALLLLDAFSASDSGVVARYFVQS